MPTILRSRWVTEQRYLQESRSGAGLVTAAQAQNPPTQRRPRRLTFAREKRNPQCAVRERRLPLCGW